jgi:hypothetical protein
MIELEPYFLDGEGVTAVVDDCEAFGVDMRDAGDCCEAEFREY